MPNKVKGWAGLSRSEKTRWDLVAKTKRRRRQEEIAAIPVASRRVRGEVRADGLVFAGYHTNRASLERWVTPEQFVLIRERAAASSRRAYAQIVRGGHKRGETRSDGLRFWCYVAGYPDGQRWVSPDKFQALAAAARASSRQSQNRPESKAKKRAWKKANPEIVRRVRRGSVSRRRQGDSEFRIREKLRTRMRAALFRSTRAGDTLGRSLDSSTVGWLLWLAKRLGIDPRDGRKNHIEHLRPARCFDLTTEEGQRAFNAPENTWWLTAKDNLSKNDRDPTPEEIELHGLYLAEYRQTQQ